MIDIGSQVPGRFQTDDSSLLTPICIRSGSNIGWSQVSLILLAITCENLGRSCTGRKSVVSHHKSVGGRSQVYNDGRALVGEIRLEFHADRHTSDMRGLPPSHVSHKSFS